MRPSEWQSDWRIARSLLRAKRECRHPRSVLGDRAPQDLPPCPAPGTPLSLSLGQDCPYWAGQSSTSNLCRLCHAPCSQPNCFILFFSKHHFAHSTTLLKTTLPGSPARKPPRFSPSKPPDPPPLPPTGPQLFHAPLTFQIVHFLSSPNPVSFLF